MSRFVARPALALALALSANVGCKHGEDLDPPSMHIRSENGLCGWQVGIEARGSSPAQMWFERGCENGNPKMRKYGHLDAETTAWLFEQLRAIEGPNLSAEPYARIHARLAPEVPALEPYDGRAPVRIVVQSASGERRTYDLAAAPSR